MKHVINLFEITQPIGCFYLGKISSEILQKIATVKPRKQDSIGIQRELKSKRIPEIAKYCEDPDAAFPTPIIVSANSKDCNFVNNETVVGLYTLSFDDENFQCEVLDGQHRLAGIKEAVAFKTELPIVFMFDLKDSEKAYIFSTINSNQTKVDRSLIYDLFGLSKKRSPQQTCHEIARILNSDKASPFYLRLKMLGKKTNENESLSQGTFISYLMKHISKNEQNDMVNIKNDSTLEKNDKLIFREFFIEGKDEYILKILMNYFSALAKIFNEEWNDSKQYILSKTTGYGAFMKALPIIVQNGFDNKDVTQDFFEQKFSILKNKMEKDNKQFIASDFISGEAGQKQLSNYILASIGLCRICGKPLNEAQYSEDRAYKSCPNCSTNEGIHIFYKYPEGFGTTELRITQNNPEGGQSHCKSCRANKQPDKNERILCNEIKK